MSESESPSPKTMSEQAWLRQRAVVLARESGLTFREIAKRHGISTQRAQQIFRAGTWPTDVAEAEREANRQRWERWEGAQSE